MFDLNTIITNALNQAIEQATKPLIARLERLEAQAIAENTATEDHALLHRLDSRVDRLEAHVEDAITADQVSSLIEEALNEIDWEEQVRDVLDHHDINEQINDAIDEMLSELRISRR
jgi:hypothetical protein